MVKVVYVQPDGAEKAVDVPEGRSVMEGAVTNGVSGIVAECGGACSCATCHAYVDPAWLDAVGAAGEDERDMLDFLDSARPNSRLTCQIELSGELDGLRLEIPQEQG